MAQPPAYTIATDFSADEASAVSGRSTVRTANLDTELINIKAFVDAMRTNIALVQADDGTIKDDAVDLPALADDVINWISTNGNGWYAADTGAVNAMVVTLDPVPTSLTNGMFVVSDIKLTNTSATVTLNVNGLGAKAVVTDGAGTTPAIGALTIGTFYGFQYDSSADKFQIVFSGDSLTHSASASASATAAAASATSANTAKLAAEAALDAFDDKYLGSFALASEPTVDNDGDALVDGALYYETTNNVLMVYDLGTTTWLRTTPTSSEQTAINTVSGIASNVTTVAGISGNVTTVAGISSNVTSVAGNATNINTVAGNNANVTTVAGISSDVTAVAGNNANVTTVAGSIANVNTTATNIADVNNFANTYRIASADPTTSLDEGDLVFRTDTDTMRVYNGSAWQDVAPTSSANIFGTIAVSGQSNVVADSTTDTLNIATGDASTLTVATNAGTDTVTFTGIDNSVPMAIALG
tara:strand:- start:432 stop:1847 length:1416 start_codon:yes stop_codon:yes gene_type:complete